MRRWIDQLDFRVRVILSILGGSDHDRSYCVGKRDRQRRDQKSTGLTGSETGVDPVAPLDERFKVDYATDCAQRSPLK